MSALAGIQSLLRDAEQFLTFTQRIVKDYTSVLYIWKKQSISQSLSPADGRSALRNYSINILHRDSKRPTIFFVHNFAKS